MTALAALVSAAGQDAFLSAYVVFLRVGAAMALFPVFGEAAVPARVRLGLAIAFTLVVAPAVTGDVAAIVRDGRVLGLFTLSEPAVGLIFGLTFRLLLIVLAMCGTIIAQTTSLSQMFSFAGVEPSPVVAHIMTVAALALAAQAGLHVRLAEGLIASYGIIAPGTFPGVAGLSAWSLSHIAGAVSLSFGLAMPFLIASTLYSLATGIINRAMPQLMVSMIGAPAQVLGALILLAVGVPAILTVWLGRLDTVLADPFGVLR